MKVLVSRFQPLIALFFIASVFLVGCQSPKKSAELKLPKPELQPVVSSDSQTEETFSQVVTEAQDDLENPPEEETFQEFDEDQVDIADSSAPGAGAQERLEAALQACQQAQTDWKEGNMVEALTKLDDAFRIILEIGEENQDPLILQEKEDLRFLISKRIVEIYASQRTAVGELKKSIPLVMNSEVEKEIASFQGRERNFFLDSYRRSGKYRPMILAELRKAGLPEQLSWLPLIESGFKPNALSRARALGLWQFIPSTGYRYGLERNEWVDERMDPHKSTLGAIAYLEDLHSLFGDWMTVLAGYNCGEGRVLRVINQQRLNYLDNFWDLYNQLPRETARYVPRFMATLAILEDPEKYGFELPELDDRQDFTVVEVGKSVQLKDVDTFLDLPEGTLRGLNPELRHRMTPDVVYPLRIPLGKDALFDEGIAGMPLARPPVQMASTHTVRRGETLSSIASRYRSSVKSLMATNGLRRSTIFPGQKLKVPGRGNAESSALPSQTGAGTWVTHRVRRGDSLWRIANQYRTSVENIRFWNNLKSNRLALNQKLRVLQGHTQSVASKTYKVRNGDTLAQIAKRHGVTLNALLNANQLSTRDPIFPNQELIIP